MTSTAAMTNVTQLMSTVTTPGLLANVSSPGETTLTEEEQWRLLEELNLQNVPLILPVGVILVLLALAGLLGNALVLVVYWRKFRPSTTRLFILSLAAVDLLTCLLSIPGELVDFRFYHNFPSAHLCRFLRFNNAFTSIGSGVLILPMAADRYRRICRPMQRQMTPLAAKVAIAISCLLSFLLAAPFALLSGIKTEPQQDTPGLNASICSFSDQTEQASAHIVLMYLYFLVLFVCFVVLITLYSLIGLQVWRRKRFQSGSVPPSSSSSQRRRRRVRPPPPAPSSDTGLPSESESSPGPRRSSQEASRGGRRWKATWRRGILDKFGKKPKLASSRFYRDPLPLDRGSLAKPAHAGPDNPSNHGNAQPLALTNRAFVNSVYESEGDPGPPDKPETQEGEGCRPEQNANDERAVCTNCRPGTGILATSTSSSSSSSSSRHLEEDWRGGQGDGDQDPRGHRQELPAGLQTDGKGGGKGRDSGQNCEAKVSFAEEDSVLESDVRDHSSTEREGEKLCGLAESQRGEWKPQTVGEMDKNNGSDEVSGVRVLEKLDDAGEGSARSPHRQAGGETGQPSATQDEEDPSHVTISDSECSSTDEECVDTSRSHPCNGDVRKDSTPGGKPELGETPSFTLPAYCEQEREEEKQEKGPRSRLLCLCPCVPSRKKTRISFPIRRSSMKPVRASRTTLILFFIVLVFILSYLPFLILVMVREVDDGFVASMTPAGLQCYNVFLRTFFINAASNPLIYSFLNVRFRSECRKLFSLPDCLRCS